MSTTIVPAKSVALLFGLNYKGIQGAELNGCINDVREISTILKDKFGFEDILLYEDDTNPTSTTLLSMVKSLQNLALRSWTENLERVWIHYSGHGTYIKDKNSDERDGRDEALVPRDFNTSGVLLDDDLSLLLTRFNPKTRVVFVCDACHSGTMCDLTFRWISNTRKVIENTKTKCSAPVILLSGCMDTQTSADAFMLNQGTGQMQYQGAMTNALVRALKEDTAKYASNAFALSNRVRDILKSGGFRQYPELSSSYDLNLNPVFCKSV